MHWAAPSTGTSLLTNLKSRKAAVAALADAPARGVGASRRKTFPTKAPLAEMHGTPTIKCPANLPTSDSDIV